jgi:hypothetical protein
MSLRVILGQLRLHATPLETLSVDGPSLTIEFDDVEEKRWRVSFRPYQALRLTTMDCIFIEPFVINGRYPSAVLEMIDSAWVRDLADVLREKDHAATFMNKAHHYVFPFQDRIVEVVAWDNYTFERLEGENES